MIGRVALLGDYGDKPRIRAFRSSCLALGLVVEPVRRADLSNPDHFDFAFTSGKRASELPGFARFRRAGKHVVVLDLGYVNRASYEDQSGYHQVGLDRIGWIPETVPDDERFLDLGLAITSKAPRPSAPALILGQMPGDSQHPFSAPRAMHWWLKNALSLASRKLGQNPPTEVIYRPHPLAKRDRKLPEFSSQWKIQDPSEMPLEDAVQGSCYVVTYNSTAALEAIQSGVPVVCAQEAHYSEVAYGSVQERLNYFQRLAYAQWTLKEIEDGDPLRFLAPRLGMEVPT